MSMIFSKACEYSIRALIFIAQKSDDETRVNIKEISENTGAPAYFTSKVLQDLTKKDLLSSLKGPTGGFYLSAANRQVALLDIVKAVDGNKIFSSCGLGINNCSEKNPCPLHEQYKPIREQLHKMLKTTTIQDLAEDITKGNAFLNKP